ncbi:TPA: lysozyme, partial [Listeria monocytogenes]|nr:lysozyme [Listeria monocytogenes]
KKDVARFEEGVNKLVTVELNENQFSALVSFSYNLGLGNLKSSDLLELTNKKEFDKAAKEFDRWVYAKGRMLPGLVKRRDAEQALFMKKVPKVEIKKPTKKFLSLVDYLKANHKPADFISRRKLAESHGIKNYTGRAEENIKLLNILQK